MDVVKNLINNGTCFYEHDFQEVRIGTGIFYQKDVGH